MLNIKRIKGRQGFTMIELLVVIGIIAVLSAIIVPFALMNRGSARVVNEKARDFYYTAQSIMTDIRLSRDPDIKLNGSVLIEIDKANAGVKILNDTSLATNEVKFNTYLRGKLRLFLQQEENQNEFYYFEVDPQYRVVCVYMANSKIISSPLPNPTLDFGGENRLVTGELVGVFPIELAATNYNFTP